MYSAVMILFYGFLAGLLVMFAGFSVKKQVARHTAELISALGGTLSACCFVLILCCGYLSTITM